MACKSVQRTLAALRKLGYTAEVTEKWIPFFGKGDEDNPKQKRRGVRKDLFGFCDIEAIGKGPTLRVQACDMSSRKEHIEIILNEPNALKCLRGGDRIELWVWRKLKQKKKDGTFSKVAKYEAKRFEIKQCENCKTWTGTEKVLGYCRHCNNWGMIVEEKSDD